jgi:hypothetical protein
MADLSAFRLLWSDETCWRSWLSWAFWPDHPDDPEACCEFELPWFHPELADAPGVAEEAVVVGADPVVALEVPVVAEAPDVPAVDAEFVLVADGVELQDDVPPVVVVCAKTGWAESPMAIMLVPANSTLSLFIRRSPFFPEPVRPLILYDESVKYTFVLMIRIDSPYSRTIAKII